MIKLTLKKSVVQMVSTWALACSPNVKRLPIVIVSLGRPYLATSFSFIKTSVLIEKNDDLFEIVGGLTSDFISFSMAKYVITARVNEKNQDFIEATLKIHKSQTTLSLLAVDSYFYKGRIELAKDKDSFDGVKYKTEVDRKKPLTIKEEENVKAACMELFNARKDLLRNSI